MTAGADDSPRTKGRHSSTVTLRQPRQSDRPFASDLARPHQREAGNLGESAAWSGSSTARPRSAGPDPLSSDVERDERAEYDDHDYDQYHDAHERFRPCLGFDSGVCCLPRHLGCAYRGFGGDRRPRLKARLGS